MLSTILVLVITMLSSFLLISKLKRRYPFIDARLLKQLYFFHLFMSVVYYLYAVLNPSDSHFYYEKVMADFRGASWMDFYGTSTTFVEFIGYPFIKFLGFSYEAIMILFSFIGFLGFVYFYVFFREHVRYKHTLFGADLITIFFFLPNLHFWSASFGKGSLIFIGMALYFFGMSNLRRRFLAIIIGSLVIYHVRPHIMLIVILGSIVGFVFSSKRLGIVPRLAFLMAAMTVFFFIYQDVLALVGVDEGEVMSQGLDLTHRATELTKATSGVDITNYSLPMQVFTFLYRPLFIDAPGALGLIVSFENVFYLFMSIRLFTFSGIRFLWSSDFLVKSSIITFILVSIALAQISGNLGIAIRQKCQIMPLFLYAIITFMDDKKRNSIGVTRKKPVSGAPAEPLKTQTS